MDIDTLIKKLGNPGRYHVIVTIVLGLSCWTQLGYNHIVNVFYGAVPPHRCVVPAGYSLNESLPVTMTTSGAKEMSSCLAYENFTRDSGKEVTCPLGWEFMLPSSFPVEATIATEFVLVCDRLYLNNLAITIYFVGVMVGGLLFGYLADRWGRKTVLLACFYPQLLISGSLYFVHDYVLFVVLRFIVGALIQGLQMTSLNMIIELDTPARRGVTGPVLSAFALAGTVLLAPISYLLRDWHYIQLAISLPSFVFLFFIWAIPESPRWLVAKDRGKEAVSVFKAIAKFNKVDVTEEDLKSAVINTESHETRGNTNGTPNKREYNLIDLVRTPTLRTRSLTVFFLGFSVSLGYYGLTFNIPSLVGDKYLNFFIAAAIDLPLSVITAVVITKKGRKPAVIFGFTLGGVLCIVAPFVPTRTVSGTDIALLQTSLQLTGRAAILVTYVTLHLYSSELFPTVTRNMGAGGYFVCARIGSLISPQILQLGFVTSEEVPIVIFGVSLLASALLCGVVLPETLGKNLPDTIGEAEMFDKNVPYINRQSGIDNLCIVEENTHL